MESFQTLFKKLKPAGIKKLLTDANMIFASVLFLACVFLAMVAVDAYLFYTVRTSETAALPPPAPPAALSAKDIDEVIKLIDQREQEYQALLNSK
ncbi:MAG: hypothetical protein WAP52_02055 [Candidatus Sungiibacteriota bacterium]